MKLNSPKSIEAAEKVFRTYGSWTAAREAATRRDPDGVLVIPKRVDSPPGDRIETMPARAGAKGR